MSLIQGLLGMVVLLGCAWLLSSERSQIRLRLVVTGLALHLLLAGLLLRIPWISEALLWLNHIVRAIEQATVAGASFVFGYLGSDQQPFAVADPSNLYLFAFRVLPQILVFSVLVAVFWYLGVLPRIVRGIGVLLRRSLGISGPVGTAAGASVFLGMVETPLVVRAYLQTMSSAELFTVMTCGMSTVAGSIMVLYASVLGPVLDGALGHILSASLLNIIAAIIVAHIMRPDGAGAGAANAADRVEDALRYRSLMDAISRGTADGLRLAVNVGAMVLVFVALVALLNQVLGAVEVFGAPLRLERLLGWLFAPIAWLLGIPWVESQTAGALLGTKLVINEVVAYLELVAVPESALGTHSRLIMIYALCGFANFGSLGILLAGLSTLVPDRRDEVLRTAPWSLVSGTLATLLTGCVVGLIAL